jgi:hypothetical protein
MFEAMICSSSSRAPRRDASDAIRRKTLRRGMIAPITSLASSATQSPTVGKSALARAEKRNDPETVAGRSPAPSRTMEVSRWTATTRAGR